MAHLTGAVIGPISFLTLSKGKFLKKKILFLNLTTFSKTGGIEKFNRCFLKALSELETENSVYSNSHSLYDLETDEQYYPSEKYTGFGQEKPKFVLSSIKKARRFNYIVLGHINLAIVGVILKILLPRKKIILITHGIEVWGKLPFLHRLLLRMADQILSVSNFTKEKILELESIQSKKISIFPNTIDPYFPIPASFEKELSLRASYGLKASDFVLFTLTRLSSKEQYKGYDIVIKSLPVLLQKYPIAKYVIAGMYDEIEKERIDALIKELGLSSVVNIAGYIEDDMIVHHYQMSDVFIMPSQKEGFGIVFIEAMVCGVQVIAGNMDGSVDALHNGELGQLVDPESEAEIIDAIERVANNMSVWDAEKAFGLQQKALNYFGFPQYKQRLKQILYN